MVHWKDIPLNKLKLFACFCPSEQALNIWYSNKALTASLDKITRDKINSLEDNLKENVIVVVRRLDFIIGYAIVKSSASEKDEIPVEWNKLVCVSDRKAASIFSGKKDGQEITDVNKAEKLLKFLDESPSIETLDELKEKMNLGEPEDMSDILEDEYNDAMRPKCDFDITNMTYEEYLVEFNNRAQMAYNNFRVSMGRGGYQGKHFDPNYRGRGRGRGPGRGQ